MTLTALVLVALALSADNFAIALAVGAARAPRSGGALIRLPLIFGACSLAAPLVGWALGSPAVGFFRGYAGVVAFVVLAFVGWRMLRSAWQPAAGDLLDVSSFRNAVILGLATSGDSLAVGFGLAMTHVNIVLASMLIGGVTTIVSIAGIRLGAPLGRAFGAHSKIAAGLVLILVGAHALVTHA